jgi:hypothetical protein
MKGEDILKYVLIAVAAYLVYKWAQEQGYLGGGVAQPALPPGTQPAIEPPVVTTQPALAKPAPTTPPKPPSVDELVNVVKAAMGPSWDGKMTVDQWNYFFAQVSGEAQGWYTQEMRTRDAGKTFPLQDYLAMRQWALSGGVRGLASWPVVNAWAN